MKCSYFVTCTSQTWTRKEMMQNKCKPVSCLSALWSSGLLEWPFWTKLVVVAIGFTGGLVFMYVQCKVYIHLWRRLKAYNRVIYVQNRPDTCKKLVLEKPPLMEPSLENKEALVPTLSDTNSSQYTETEDYSMEVLHVWPLSPCHWSSYSYFTHRQAHSEEQPLWKCPSSDPRLTHCPPLDVLYSLNIRPQRPTDNDYLLLSTFLLPYTLFLHLHPESTPRSFPRTIFFWLQ